MTEVEISHSGRRLEIGDTVREFEYEILDRLVYQDLVVVLLSFPSHSDIRDNVVAFDMDGKKQWRIDPVSTEARKGSLVYTAIRESEGKLIADNWNGASYEVDPDTGSVELYHNPRST